MRIGRPKKSIEKLDITSFKEEIVLFKNSLIDYMNDEETREDKQKFILKFFKLDLWRQNLFIVYLIVKGKKKTVNEMAECLNVEKEDIMKEVRMIKKELMRK